MSPSHTFRRWFALLSILLASLPAMAQQPAAPFTEIKGEREFRGVLVARPLQAREAAARGMDERALARSRVEAIRSLNGTGVLDSFPEVDEFLIRVPAGETENMVAARLMATGNFEYVEPDWRVFPIGCPNDATFSQQWHHAANRLASCSAWDLETGSPTVVVAICDTGILTTHEDLQLHRREGFNVTSRTWESAGGAIADINGHGTNCTGSAAANGNNGVGVAGMGWNLAHRMMRVTDLTDGSASISNLTLAARTAADRGDKVASVSYSGVNSSSVFTTGTYVRSKGALLVWAAGNSNAALSGNREDDVIVVGATDQNDLRASFSNYGTLVDVFAPGVSIRTTSRSGNSAYASVSGTSFACPITAGLCGLIWSRNPTLTPAQVEAILRSTCADLGATGVDSTFGYGRINAAAAIAATPPTGPDLTPPSAPTGLAAVGRDMRVDLSWSASPEADVAGYRVYRAPSASGPFVELTAGLVSGTTYSDLEVINGTAYHYVARAQDISGNVSDASASASATPAPPAGPVTIFADGFESGNLGAGGWAAQNSNASAMGAAALSGAFGARVRGNCWIERSVSTAGYADVALRYARRTSGMDNNEWLYVEWWDGAAWRVAEQTRTTAAGVVDAMLPASADGNGAFRIRFRSKANQSSTEWADVDSVEVIGTPLP